jgi:hypothetical protein
MRERLSRRRPFRFTQAPMPDAAHVCAATSFRAPQINGASGCGWDSSRMAVGPDGQLGSYPKTLAKVDWRSYSQLFVDLSSHPGPGRIPPCSMQSRLGPRCPPWRRAALTAPAPGGAHSLRPGRRKGHNAAEQRKAESRLRRKQRRRATVYGVLAHSRSPVD